MNAEQLERGSVLQKKIRGLEAKIEDLENCNESSTKLRFMAHSETHIIADVFVDNSDLTQMVAAMIKAKLTTELQALKEEFERL